jgi:hypothetical protein
VVVEVVGGGGRAPETMKTKVDCSPEMTVMPTTSRSLQIW